MDQCYTHLSAAEREEISSGEAPSTYALVGIDDFAVGFRAGYFLRNRRGSVPAVALSSRLVSGSPRPGANSIVEDLPALLSAS